MKGVSFIVDAKGRKKQVVLDLSLYGARLEELLEDILDYNEGIEALRTEKRIPFEVARKKLLAKK